MTRRVYHVSRRSQDAFKALQGAPRRSETGIRRCQEALRRLEMLSRRAQDGSRRLKVASKHYQYVSKATSRNSKSLLELFQRLPRYRYGVLRKHIHRNMYFWTRYQLKSIIVEGCMQRNHYFYKSKTASKAPQDASKTSPGASIGLANHVNRVLRRSRTASGRFKTASNTLRGRVLRRYWPQTWHLICVYWEIVVLTSVRTLARRFKTAQSHLKTLPTRL